MVIFAFYSLRFGACRNLEMCFWPSGKFFEIVRFFIGGCSLVILEDGFVVCYLVYLFWYLCEVTYVGRHVFGGVESIFEIFSGVFVGNMFVRISKGG